MFPAQLRCLRSRRLLVSSEGSIGDMLARWTADLAATQAHGNAGSAGGSDAVCIGLERRGSTRTLRGSHCSSGGSCSSGSSGRGRSWSDLHRWQLHRAQSDERRCSVRRAALLTPHHRCMRLNGLSHCNRSSSHAPNAQSAKCRLTILIDATMPIDGHVHVMVMSSVPSHVSGDG